MTREILFRGKRIDNGEWVYGAYHKHDTVKVCIAGDDPKTKHIIIADGFCDWGFEPPLMGYHVDPSTVGQFTGLCDKNGRKIFEGDIVLVSWSSSNNTASETYVVVYSKSGFFCKDKERLLGQLSNYVYRNARTIQCEVIGNIVDNPELLEGEV